MVNFFIENKNTKIFVETLFLQYFNNKSARKEMISAKNCWPQAKNFFSVLFGMVETVYLHLSFRDFQKSTSPKGPRGTMRADL